MFPKGMTIRAGPGLKRPLDTWPLGLSVIAFGISGQIQHLAGMQDSGIIISVNSDPEAPINAIADYVINGTVEEVLPKMIKYYKANNK